VAEFESKEGEAARAEMKKVFAELKMPVPDALAAGRSVGDLMDCVNDAFMADLELPQDKLKEAYALRAKISDSFRKQQAAIVPEFREIDWDKYKKELGDAAMVDSFKEALDKTLAAPELKALPSVESPSPLLEAVVQAEKDMVALVDAVAKEADADAVELKKLQDRLAAINSEIDRIQKGTVTLDEELGKNPELAAEIDEDILNDKWGA